MICWVVHGLCIGCGLVVEVVITECVVAEWRKVAGVYLQTNNPLANNHYQPAVFKQSAQLHCTAVLPLPLC